MKIIDDRERGIVANQYKDGWPIRKIAAYASLSQTTVMKIVRETGIPLRDNKRYNQKKRKDVQTLYDTGMKITDIMQQTGIRSEQTIYRIVKAGRRLTNKNDRHD